MSHSIIGSGNIGGAIAAHFERAGVAVAVANRHSRAEEMTRALAADVVIVSVPFTAAGELGRTHASWNGRIVVDTTNAIDFPAFTPTDLGGRPSTAVLAEQFPGARVVKAFCTLPAHVLRMDPAEASGGGKRVLFLSGDDAAANATVAALIEKLGFAAIDIGSLETGGRLMQFAGPLAAQSLLLQPMPSASTP